MVDTWLKALNAGKLVGCVMVDFRKAFDLVDHQILLKKITALYEDDPIMIETFLLFYKPF